MIMELSHQKRPWLYRPLVSAGLRCLSLLLKYSRFALASSRSVMPFIMNDAVNRLRMAMLKGVNYRVLSMTASNRRERIR